MDLTIELRKQLYLAHGTVTVSCFFTFGFIGKKAINFLHCPVVGTDNEAMVVHVQDEILALKLGKSRGRERKEKERERGKRAVEVVNDSNNVEVKLRKWCAL